MTLTESRYAWDFFRCGLLDGHHSGRYVLSDSLLFRLAGRQQHDNGRTHRLRGRTNATLRPRHLDNSTCTTIVV